MRQRDSGCPGMRQEMGVPECDRSARGSGVRRGPSSNDGCPMLGFPQAISDGSTVAGLDTLDVQEGRMDGCPTVGSFGGVLLSWRGGVRVVEEGMVERIRCVVTAGPTREYFDPVRFLSNPSTGKMGFALARAAVEAGWEVSLVSGPVALATPEGVRRMDVESADEMYAAGLEVFEACDVLIMSAAVSDMKPKLRMERKVKKEELELTLEMERTVDILRTLGGRKEGRFLVGFAAETERVEEHAFAKLRAKNWDLIVGNLVGVEWGGFASDENQVVILDRSGGRTNFGPAGKDAVARAIVGEIARRIQSGQEAH